MARKSGGSKAWRFLAWPLVLLSVSVLPFFMLVRLSVWMYTAFECSAWTAIGVTALLTATVLYVSLNQLTKILSGKKKTKEKTRRFNLRAALLAVGAFTFVSMLYISASNTKTSMVQSEYASMHPLLRMGVSVMLLFDREAVVTDMSRTHQDYQEMKLTVKKKSLHYPQSDGFVHALDLRTNDRDEGRNEWVEWYFRLMGFRTLRHHGTEDHLHVSLMIHDNPGAL